MISKIEKRQRYKRRSRLRERKKLALYTIHDTFNGTRNLVEYLCTYLRKDHQNCSGSSDYVSVL